MGTAVRPLATILGWRRLLENEQYFGNFPHQFWILPWNNPGTQKLKMSIFFFTFKKKQTVTGPRNGILKGLFCCSNSAQSTNPYEAKPLGVELVLCSDFFFFGLFISSSVGCVMKSLVGMAQRGGIVCGCQFTQIKSLGTGLQDVATSTAKSDST